MNSSARQPDLRSDLLPSECRLPRLLVSVRDMIEVEIAIDSGVDIIDLKEPRAGALAPTDRYLWMQVAQRWDRMRCFNGPPWLSAALGEPGEAVSRAAQLPHGFHFAKAGPCGCGSTAGLTTLWTDVRERLPPRTELVAVAYADWKTAGCPAPEDVFRQAAEFGLRHCLLDTFEKKGQSTVSLLGMIALRELATLARQLRLWWALAGSIAGQEVVRLLAADIVPGCFGVRGDVCQGRREGSLQAERVRSWMDILQGSHTVDDRWP